MGIMADVGKIRGCQSEENYHVPPLETSVSIFETQLPYPGVWDYFWNVMWEEWFVEFEQRNE